MAWRTTVADEAPAGMVIPPKRTAQGVVAALVGSWRFTAHDKADYQRLHGNDGARNGESSITAFGNLRGTIFLGDLGRRCPSTGRHAQVGSTAGVQAFADSSGPKAILT